MGGLIADKVKHYPNRNDNKWDQSKVFANISNK